MGQKKCHKSQSSSKRGKFGIASGLVIDERRLAEHVEDTIAETEGLPLRLFIFFTGFLIKTAEEWLRFMKRSIMGIDSGQFLTNKANRKSLNTFSDVWKEA